MKMIDQLITQISEGIIVTENNLCEQVIETWICHEPKISDFKRCKICIHQGMPDSFLLYFDNDLLGMVERELPFITDEQGSRFRVTTKFTPSPNFAARFRN